MKERLSNIELLRIVAIFFVLMCHAIMMVHGLPKSVECKENILSSYLITFFSSIAISGVDIFVLISGWFGIHVTKKGLTKYIFQICFLTWGIFLINVVLGKATFSIDALKICLGMFHGYWFVIAYLGLFLLSPILNVFVKNVSKRDFQIVLFSFYIFQCIYSWISGTLNYYQGYSILFFCNLYLTARYFKLYPLNWISCNSLKLYLILTMVISLIAFFALAFLGNAAKMLRYDNPLIILSSLSLLIFFSRLRIKSMIINYLAISCLSVYIIHYNPYIYGYFVKSIIFLTHNYDGFSYSILMVLFLLCVFILCVLIDQIRIKVWNIIFRLK